MAHVNKFGRNADVDSAAAEDIWDGGGIHVPPTAARLHDIVSTDAADDAAGTGARTVEIQGLDSDYKVQSETVTMDGTTDVETANSYVRIFRMKVVTAGSGGVNAGTITATAQIDSTVSAQIAIGNNQTLMAIYTVPVGVWGQLTNYYVSVLGTVAAIVTVRLWIRPFDEVWQLKHVLHTDPNANGYFNHQFGIPLDVSPKSDVRIEATTTANDTDVAGGFDLKL